MVASPVDSFEPSMMMVEPALRAPSTPLFRGSSSVEVEKINNILSLGIYLRQEILRDKGLRNGFLRNLFQSPAQASVPSVKGSGVSKDVLPLPLPSLKDLELWLETEDSMPSKHKGRQARKHLAAKACESVWLWLVVLGLNHEYCVDDVLSGNCCESASGVALSQVQSEVIVSLKDAVQRWSAQPLKEFPLENMEDLFKKSCLAYGEEITTALPMVAGELEPGLPAIGIAGTVQAVNIVAPEVAHFLLNPHEQLLPEEEWPPEIPKARMNCTRLEWEKIAVMLWKRSMVKAIPLKRIFHVKGRPVFNGAFAVTKKGTPLKGFSRLTRLIVNLVPSNAYFRMLQTDLNTLSPSSSWTQIVIGEGEILLWSSDDQKGAYYVFQLPPCWLPFMAFAWPVRGELLGLKGEVYLSMCVIPMGWSSAVALFQHIHRRLGFAPFGSRFPESLEWRRDRPLPIYLPKQSHWVQFYLDDFDSPEILPQSQAEELEGTVGPAQTTQRETYKQIGISISQDKAVHREPIVERMGAKVDGILGSVGVPQDKLFIASIMCLFLLSCVCVHLRCLQAALGRVIRAFEFRRPLFGCLNLVWRFGQDKMVERFSMQQRTELLIALSLMPLAFSDIRAPISGLVTASDASETGGGCCVSGGLTSEGLQELEKASSQEPSMTGRLVDTEKLDSCTLPIQKILGKVPSTPCARILIVGLFDGIAGLLCAVSRLPVIVVGFAASEIESKAKKLVRKRWPGVIELGDITKVDDNMIQSLARTYSGIVDFVLVGAGSPCQDLSSLLFEGKGLAGERSKLFFEVPRIVRLLRSCFKAVHFFVENVFSMTDESRATFSAVLGIKPYLVDAVNFTYCRRPRLFWCNWKLTSANARIIDHGSYFEVFVSCQKLSPDFWLDPGHAWDTHQGFVPTLTRALPAKKPPRQPAGLTRASDTAKARWIADEFCFQVYQYEDRAMVLAANGQRLLPSITERELLMGFDRDYTAAAFSEKESARAKFVESAQMIGNSFCVPVIAFITSELLLVKKLVPAPLPPELGLAIKVSEKPWSSSQSFVAGPVQGDTDKSRLLTWEFLRRAERGGSDVRLGLNVPFRPKAWPRAGIKPHCWTWHIVHGYPWQYKAHINVLEMQAAFNCLKWRARKASNLGKRFLHLIDSQVCAAILTKGRTSSLRIRRTIRKINALVLACNFHPCFGYINTDDNPADVPSRWARRSRRSKSKRSKSG